MRKGLVYLRMEGSISQGKLESSIAAIPNLIRNRGTLTDSRMTKMTSPMKEWGRQDHNHMKSVSDLKQRLAAEVKNRMLELMATIQVLTLCEKAAVTQPVMAHNCPPSMPIASIHANVLSTSAFPSQQENFPSHNNPFRKVAIQSMSRPSTEYSNTPNKRSYHHRQWTRRSQKEKAKFLKEFKQNCGTAICPARHLWTLMPEVLRQPETTALWPAAWWPTTLSTKQWAAIRSTK